jgi:alpha-2-macroglobulin
VRVRVVTTKDLLIRPQTPNFLVVGDHAELAALVNNTTSQALEATVSLQATGLTLDDPTKAQQKVNIPANGRIRVSWSGLVQAVDAVDAIFSVTSGNLQDASRPTDGPIPVLHYSAPQTFSTAGILTGASTRQEIIAVPRSFQPMGGNLHVELSPSMASVILNSLKAIESPETPWSSEQIVSSFLPNVATYRTLMESNLDDPDLTARLKQDLRIDLSHLLAYQAEDGGFKWTMNSQESDPYLTAYVLFGLEQVFQSGLDVGSIDIAGASQRGRAYLFSIDPGIDLEGPNARGNINRTIFSLYVLQNTGGLADFDYLVDQLSGVDYRDKLDPWARALLASIRYSRSPDDEQAATLLSDLESTAIRSATGAHWESPDGDWMNPGTPLFTTAIVVNVLAGRDPNTPLLADAVRYLASQQDAGGRWASSYQTTWVILALDKIMQATGELGGSFSFSAALNSTPLAHGQASGPQNLTPVTANTPLTQLNLSGANSLLISRLDGTGKLYYRAALTVDRPVETAPALDLGIAVSRQFMDCSGSACQPITSYQMKPDESGRITVRLTITLSHDAYYQMVQDYIPAGSDILDSSLKTSQQGQPDQSVQAQFDPADPFGEGWGWWYFNSPKIYNDHILWSADYLPAGTYVLTYTIVPSLAGQYRVLPAHVWQAYFPEVQGTSAGAVFEIRP